MAQNGSNEFGSELQDAMLVQVLRDGLKDIDGEGIRSRRRREMKMEACNWLCVTERWDVTSQFAITLIKE